MKPAEFIAALLPAALEAQRAHRIPASFIIAQAALETGWGKHVRGNNLFGIKADRSWKGPVTRFTTHEVLDGARQKLQDRFRAYASWADSMRDQAAFLAENPRYQACFKEITGPGWARAVASAGYATDPNYADRLIAVMNGRKLTQHDPKGQP